MAIIELLVTGTSTKREDIFCTSDGTPIQSGTQFSSKIKEEIKECQLCILVLSENFSKSKFCLSELGATWVIDKNILPIIIPPENFDYFNEEPLIGTHATIITDTNFTNTLYEKLKTILELPKNHSPKWQMVSKTFEHKIQDICKATEHNRYKFDFFISSPMSFPTNEEYQTNRALIMSVLDKIAEINSNYRCYFAGININTLDEFDSNRDSAENDLKVLDESRSFVMILPSENLKTSCFVEAGYAIAKNKPSIYFIKNDNDLPFMLKKIDAAINDIRIYEFSNNTNLLEKVQKNIKNLFS